MALQKQYLFARITGVISGLLMSAPQLYPSLAPLQLIALIPVLYLVTARKLNSQATLLAGFWMGLAYTLPQMIILRLPVTLTFILITHMTVLMVLLTWGCSHILKRPGLLSVFAVGMFLVLIDWANFTIVPIWGTAQSFVRPWSSYPSLILFTSFTGITGIIFVLGTLQAIAVRLITSKKARLPLATAGALVLLACLTANLSVIFEQPVKTLKVAAVGWTMDDYTQYGGLYSPKGFEALFAQPVEQAANKGAKLIVSPEMGFVLSDDNRKAQLEKFAQIAQQYNIFLVVGYMDIETRENKLLFMNPAGSVVAEYTKTHLTYFEDFKKGTGKPAVIDVGSIKTGAMICQDDNFTNISRKYGRRQTSLMAVPTLDWKQVKNAHLQNSIHRAIESRYAIVRAAMNGISTIISPTGKLLARRDHFTQGTGQITAEVPVYKSRTLFSIAGHWPAIVSFLYLGFYAGRSLRRPVLNKTILKIVTIFSWIAKSAGLALLLLFLAIAIGEGPPNPLKLSPTELLMLISLLVAMAGTLLAWPKQGLGGMLIVTGVLAFWIINGKMMEGWFLPVLAMAGTLNILCWLLKN